MSAETSGIASPIKVDVDFSRAQAVAGQSIVIKPEGSNSQVKVVNNGTGVEISPAVRVDVTYSPRRVSNPLQNAAASLKPQPTAGLIIDIKV